MKKMKDETVSQKGHVLTDGRCVNDQLEEEVKMERETKLKEDAENRRELEAIRTQFMVEQDERQIEYLAMLQGLVQENPELSEVPRKFSYEEIVEWMQHTDRPPPKEFCSEMERIDCWDELIANLPAVILPIELAISAVIMQLWQVVLLGEYERRRDEVEHEGGKAVRTFIVDRDPSVLGVVWRWANRGFRFHPDPMEKGARKEEITSEAHVNFFERIANYSGGFDYKRFLDQLKGELNRIPGRVRDTLRTRLENLLMLRELTRELPEITGRGSEGEAWNRDDYEILPEPLTDRSAESAEDKVLLECCFQEARDLSPRDQVIVEMTYEGFTQEEIGKKVGLTRSAVSKRRKVLFEKIRSNVESNGKPGETPNAPLERAESTPDTTNSHFSEKGPIR